ncbi:hypothetical protein HII31_05243 [Pseudocercospora fuligena]|uniref:DUF2786 domain-containing protein n=1 Tax=Pseudocercospora fuligena TaxID=685502 RepID=A0A8H6RMD2_9PEZI|nr:hypothetical protein HII31_05243 [Pseudocercospora fuligena]
MADKTEPDLADLPISLQIKLELLNLEYRDGEITQKGYDHGRSKVMARYARFLHREAHRAPKRIVFKLNAPPLFKATVVETADAAMTVRSSVADVNEGILATIKKCLDLSRHPDTPEAEAKAALLLATRRMKQYNVSQAEVLEHATPEEQQNYVGESIVHLTHRDGDPSKIVKKSVWLYPMMYAIELFFDSKASYRTYGENKTKLGIVFCGLANNSVAAAHAFEMVYSLAGEWCRKLKTTNDNCFATKKNSYMMALSKELQKMAQEEIKAEELRAARAAEETLAARIREEKAQRKAELDRLKGLSNHGNPRPVTIEDKDEDGDAEDDGVSPHTDPDSELTRGIDEVMRDTDEEHTTPISPQRVLLFQKMMKRVATSVFRNSSANCITLVATINDELESDPDLGMPFHAETEAVDILNRLIDLEVLENDGNAEVITLTRLGKQKIFGDAHGNTDEAGTTFPSDNDSCTSSDEHGHSDQLEPEDWNDDDDLDFDFDDNQSLVSTSKVDNLISALYTPEPDAPAFSSKNEVVKFREKTKQLIKDFEEKQKHKYPLTKPQTHKMPHIDKDAWSKGKEDAHKIDVRRKTITD